VTGCSSPAILRSAKNANRCEISDVLQWSSNLVTNLADNQSWLLVRMFDLRNGGMAGYDVAAHNVAFNAVAMLPAVHLGVFSHAAERYS
jgi:hypothetical protein